MGRRRVEQVRGAVRSRAVESGRGWLAALLLGIAVLVACAGLAAAQSVPDVVRPGSNSLSLPPSGSAQPAPRVTSESPLAVTPPVSPVPDRGIVAPPASGTGSPAVIAPPAGGTMPIIPPPGTGTMQVIPPPGSSGTSPPSK